MYVFEEDVPDIARVGVYAFVPPENSVVLTQLTKSNPVQICKKLLHFLPNVKSFDTQHHSGILKHFYLKKSCWLYFRSTPVKFGVQ